MKPQVFRPPSSFVAAPSPSLSLLLRRRVLRPSLLRRPVLRPSYARVLRDRRPLGKPTPGAALAAERANQHPRTHPHLRQTLPSTHIACTITPNSLHLLPNSTHSHSTTNPPSSSSSDSSQQVRFPSASSFPRSFFHAKYLPGTQVTVHHQDRRDGRIPSCGF
jgi:hypothetical protein